MSVNSVNSNSVNSNSVFNSEVQVMKSTANLEFDTGRYDQVIPSNLLEKYQVFTDNFVGHTPGDSFDALPHVVAALEEGKINPVPVEWVKQTIILTMINGDTNSLGVPKQFVIAALEAEVDIRVLNIVQTTEWEIIDGVLDSGEVEDVDCVEIFGELVDIVHGCTQELLASSVIYSGGTYFPAELKYGDGTLLIDSSMRENFYQYVAARLLDQFEAQPIEELILTLKYIRSEEYSEEDDRTPVNEVHYPVYSRNGGASASLAIDSESQVYLQTPSVEKIVNSASSIDGGLYSAKAVGALFMLSLTCGRSIDNRQLGGWIEGASNMWQVTNNNYGREPEFMEPLAVMRRNMIKCLTCQPTDAFDGAKRWPYFQLTSARFDTSVLDKVASMGVPMMPDKQSSQYLVYGAGAEAMGVWYRTQKQALKEISTYRDSNTAYTLDMAESEEQGIYVISFETAVRKLFNRHSQAYGSSMADTTDPEFFPIVDSKMGNLTSEGVSHFRGWLMRCAITNDFLNDGSGPIFTRTDWMDPSDGVIKPLYRPYGIVKSLQFTVSPHMIPANLKEYFRSQAIAKGKGNMWMTEAEPEILKLVAKAEGKSFGEGETIISLFGSNKYFKRNLVVNSKHNQKIKVLPGVRVKLNPDYNQLEVTIPVILDGEDCLIKWRGPGVKGVSSPKSDIHFEVWDCDFTKENGKLSDEDYDKSVDFVDLLNDPAKGWELYFPYESLKAQEARKVMFCHAMGGGVVEGNFITLSDGTVVDICDPLSIFSLWLKDNTHTVLVTRTIARCHYNQVVARNPKFSDGSNLIPDFEILHEDSKLLTLRYPVQVLFGEMTLGMEISSPREATGRQSFAAEQLSVISGMDYTTAANLYNNSAEYHAAVLAAVDMMTKTEGPQETGLPVLGLDSYNDFFDIMFYQKDGVDIQRSGREVFQAMKRIYPDGAYVSVDTVEFFINAEAFLGIGSFGSGGQSIGIAADIIDLFLALSALPEERGQEWESSTKGNLARVRAGWSTLCGLNERRQGMADSSSFLKRLGRTDQFSIAGKILTSSDPILNYDPETELPKVAFHPDCDMVDMLGLREILSQEGVDVAVNATTGEIASMGRVPMAMRGWFEIVIHPKAQVAYAMVLPECVAMLHEGDSDGDGEDTALDTEISYEKAMANNKDILSFGGYDAVYPDIMDQTLSEFMSIEDAWTKKVIWPGKSKIVDGKVVAYSKIPSFVSAEKVQKKYVHTFQQVRFMPCQAMAAAGRKVSEHYLYNVGTAYGWASYLSFKLAEVKYDLMAQLYPVVQSMMPNTKDPQILTERCEGVLNEGLNLQLPKGRLGDLLEASGSPYTATFSQAYEALRSYKFGCAYAWRIAYEGNGLSGYTAQASAFFEAIKFCGRRTNFAPNSAGLETGVCGKVKVVPLVEDGETIMSIDSSASNQELASEGMDIVDYMAAYHDMPAMVTQMLLEAELVRSCYTRIERYGWQSASSKFGPYAMDGAVYGALRRITGGSSMVDPMYDVFSSGMESCFTVVAAKTDGAGDLKSPILRALLTNAISAHRLISQAKQVQMGDPVNDFFARA